MKRNVLLLAGSQALLLTGITTVVSTAALVGKDLADREWLATAPQAAQLVATMLTTIPAALLMARWGRRAGFALGAAIGAVGAALAMAAILSDRFYLFIAAIALVGVFNGFGVYYRFAAADTVTEDYRSRAVSYVLAGGVVAAVAGPTLARWSRTLIPGAEFAGSYAVLIGVFAVATVIPLLTALKNPEEPKLHVRGRPLRAIAAQPRYLIALTTATLGYAVMVLLMTATPLAMEDNRHTFGLIAFVIQGHVLGMFAPSFVTGSLIARYGLPRILLSGAALTSLAVAINLSGTSGAHFWFALVALGAGWNFLFIGATTLLTTTYRPEERAKAQALNDFVLWTVVAVASLSAGALQYEFGWRVVNLGAVPMIALIVASALWLSKTDRTAAFAPS